MFPEYIGYMGLIPRPSIYRPRSDLEKCSAFLLWHGFNILWLAVESFGSVFVSLLSIADTVIQYAQL
jgi:hypothetical protein